MKSKKAQTSMEFVILTGFMLLAFLVFYVVIQAKLVEANRNSIDNSAKQVETLVVNELKVAESVTDGYYREFELPQKVNGMDYTIKIISGVGNTSEIVVQYYVPQTYVSNSSRVSKGMNNISKDNGLILLQNMTS